MKLLIDIDDGSYNRIKYNNATFGDFDRLLEALINGIPYADCAIKENKYGRQIFNGICPYINEKCEKWTCSVCEVEKRERKFMEGDTE